MCLKLVIPSIIKPRILQWVHQVQLYVRLYLVRYARHFFYYKRSIDDKCILWNNFEEPQTWDNLVKDINNCGLLKWKVENKGRKVNFLDLVITINDSNRIETRTYQNQ